MLNVAVDATAVLGRRTGIGVFIDSSLRELSKRDDLHLDAYALSWNGRHELGELLPAEIGVVRRPMVAAALLRVWSHVDIPVIEHWVGEVDVVHGMNFVVPPARDAARVVSVHDLTSLRYPELCSRTSLLYPSLVARAIASGAWVHTLSDAMRDEVIEHFGASPERVRTVHLAPAPSVLAQGGAASCRDESGIDDRTRIGGRPYVLALGTAEPRKDLPTLVRAFDVLAEQMPDLDLKLAGPRGWGEEKLVQVIDESRHHDRIERLGWVEDPTSLIRGAVVFAYPSIYEGFGLPPLEAMSLGVPVVTTRSGALPEVLGDAALFVEARDVEGLAGALKVAITDEEQRKSLVKRGMEQAGMYSWKATAAGLRGIYEDAAG